MLKNFFITFEFHRFCQSGFYFDFFYKKLTEVFVRNVFVYGAQFFGEKYIIEVLTKKVIDSIVFNTNKKIGWNKLPQTFFFIQYVSFIFFIFFIFNVFYLFF